MLAMRIGGQVDPAIALRAAKLGDDRQVHADLQQHRAEQKKIAEDKMEVAKENLLLRKLGEELAQANRAATFAKQVIDLQQKLDGTHQLTQLFLHLSELDPADPDYGIQVAQLRTSPQYSMAALLPAGNKALDDAIKSAAPAQEVYKALRGSINLSDFRKEDEHGRFMGFDLTGAQDAADARIRERAAGFGDGASLTQPMGGGASVRAARAKPLDVAGINMTPEASKAIQGAGKKAATDLRAMVDGLTEPFPAMAAGVARARRLPPEAQQQWIDDHAHEAMQQAAHGIKAEQTAKAKIDPRAHADAVTKLKLAEKHLTESARLGSESTEDQKAAARTDYEKALNNLDSLSSGASPAAAAPTQTVAPKSNAYSSIYGDKAQAAQLPVVKAAMPKSAVSAPPDSLLNGRVNPNANKPADWRTKNLRPQGSATAPATTAVPATEAETKAADYKAQLDQKALPIRTALAKLIPHYSEDMKKAAAGFEANTIAGDAVKSALGLDKPYDQAADDFHVATSQAGIPEDVSLAAHEHIQAGGLVTADIAEDGTPTLYTIADNGERTPIVPVAKPEKVVSLADEP